ncbi:MAG: hypothetical protein ABI705_09535 [Aestuariivirga sp.]
MREKSLWTQAEELVNQRQARPTEPVTAGITGLFIAGVVLAVFVGFARLDEESVATSIIVTCALGYVVPYLYFRQAQKDYLMKVKAEYHALEERKEANAKRS